MKKIFLLPFCVFIFFTAKAQFSCTGLVVTNATYQGGPQTFKVPAGVTQVRISITGGSGGVTPSVANTAGGGATVWTYVTVVTGDVFTVIIGQKGLDGDFEASGGGSSAVYKNGVLIMVAGGGGGEDNTGNGGNGVTANNGTNGAPISGSTSCPTDHVNDGLGGTGGNGGNTGEFCVANTNGGGGGGGLNSTGSFKAGVGGLSTGGGQGSITGANGGAAGTNNTGGGDGVGETGGWGWSGGGGSDHRESGGGGGYSGGGGGPEGGNPGGGGSFIAAIGTNGITNSGSSNGIGTTTGANGSGIICAVAAIVLPVTLEKFTVEKNQSGVVLNWITSGETNTSFYIVEKSNDGVHFTSIAQVNGGGNSNSLQKYSMADNTSITTKTFYRLKIVDADGRYMYSSIRFINGDLLQSMEIYPNPATDRLTVAFPSYWKTGNIRLQIINGEGKVVFQKNSSPIQEDVNISLLPTGIYLLKANNDKLKETLIKKFIK